MKHGVNIMNFIKYHFIPTMAMWFFGAILTGFMVMLAVLLDTIGSVFLLGFLIFFLAILMMAIIFSFIAGIYFLFEGIR